MASSVLGFLDSLSGSWATSSLFWVVSNFRPFLKFTGRTDLVDAVGLAGVKRSHGIVPVLSDDDQHRVVQACASRDGQRAGRSHHPAGGDDGAARVRHHQPAAGRHRLARTDRGIVQQKTNNPLTVPLTDLLVGRLADYVLDAAARLGR